MRTLRERETETEEKGKKKTEKESSTRGRSEGEGEQAFSVKHYSGDLEIFTWAFSVSPLDIKQ